MATYVGSAVRASVTIKNQAGTLIDPTTLKVEFFDGNKNVRESFIYGVDAELVKDSVGLYHADFLIPSPSGIWTVTFTSTGTGAGVGKSTFTVES